jgi:hypothetical protein
MDDGDNVERLALEVVVRLAAVLPKARKSSSATQLKLGTTLPMRSRDC